ncbi:hypothetical protein BGZ65_007763, partial [Modicella reniformis]
IFIVARVLTTRGFAAFKPGFNTRAIVTWFACTSLTLMTVYSAMLAYILYKESVAGVYAGPKPHSNYEPPSTSTSFTFPFNVSFRDMSSNPEWDIASTPLSEDQSLYYILSMKPIALYSNASQCLLFALRLVLKFSQCGLLTCLLLLNTYWCRHVEALVDEGDFMSRTEMYTYYFLAGLALFLPVSTFLGVGYGLDNWKLASRVSDVCLLVIGVSIIVSYALTCIRIRALERDSRNVNGDETSTTLQLTYYIYCVYWLVASMISIMILGILYKVTLVNPETHPVLARAVNDLQGALWSTVIIMVYPAVMFLLYPSVDVLTKPENDPGSRFQKRVRRTVKDAKQIRESLYLESESMNGVDGGRRSSLQGLTTHPGLTYRTSESGQPQTSQPQRFSFYEPIRRERMGSITAMVNEMQLIEEEDGTGSIEMVRIPEVLSDRSKDASTSATVQSQRVDDNAVSIATATATEADPKPEVSDARKNPDSLTQNHDDIGNAEGLKHWQIQKEDLTRLEPITGLEQTIILDPRTFDDSKNDSLVVMPATTALSMLTISKYDPKASTRSSLDQQQPTTPSAANPSSKTPISPRTATTTPKPVAAPLTGILKTRNSTQSSLDQTSG